MNEIWKDIENYEGLYQISNLGRIKSFKKWDINKKQYINREKILKPTDNGEGYLIIGLKKEKVRKNFYIHRLVAYYFLEKVNSKEVVNHKDFNKHNNNVNNLEWVSQKENVMHSVKNMKHRKSITHTNTKEKYIYYREKTNRYRLVIDKKEIGVFKTLQQAINKREELLNG